MLVGLGTGSTVAELVPVLGARRLDIVCVATSSSWNWLPEVHERASCGSLEAFKSFWNEQRICPDGFAATAVRQDPFGIMAWLEARYDQAFTRYHNNDLYHGLDEAGDPDDLPACYRRAYSLALQAAFASEGLSVAIELNYSLQLMEEKMRELRRILDRLVSTVRF